MEDKIKKDKSPHLDKEWLRQKYIVEGLSTYQIAKMIGRDPKSIYAKLKDFNIPTRPRGHNLIGDSEDNYMNRENKVSGFKGKHHSEETKEKVKKKIAEVKPWQYLKKGVKRKDIQAQKEKEKEYKAKWKPVYRAILEKYNYSCVKCLQFFDIKELVVFYKGPEAKEEPDLLNVENYLLYCQEHCPEQTGKKLVPNKSKDYSPKDDLDPENKWDPRNELEVLDVTPHVYPHLSLSSQIKFANLKDSHPDGKFIHDGIEYLRCYIGFKYDSDKMEEAYQSFANHLNKLFEEFNVLGKSSPIMSMPLPSNKTFILFYVYIEQLPNGIKVGDAASELYKNFFQEEEFEEAVL